MDKRSTHPVDIANWIKKVMDSCETVQQLVKADHLIYNFEKLLDRDRVKVKRNIFGDQTNREQWSKEFDQRCDLINDLNYHYLAKLKNLDNE